MGFKRIIVDGPSAGNMGRVNAIKTDFIKFCKILVERVGGINLCSQTPEYIFPPAAESIRKALITAGFEPVLADTAGSADDAEIRRKIRLTDSRVVSELILVTCDLRDFLPELRAKKAEGIDIYIVATKTPDPRNGLPMLAADSIEIIDAEFHFVELADFKDEIMREQWVDRPYQPRRSPSDMKDGRTTNLVESEEKTRLSSPMPSPQHESAWGQRLEITIGIPHGQQKLDPAPFIKKVAEAMTEYQNIDIQFYMRTFPPKEESVVDSTT